MSDIRQYGDFLAYLDHWVSQPGRSWKGLAEAIGKSVAWMRKIRNRETELSLENAEDLAAALDLSAEDRPYWLALARAAGSDVRERALARTTIWTEGDPQLTAVPPRAGHPWLQEQPLSTWFAAARPGARAANGPLRGRDVLEHHAPQRPHLQPERLHHHREAIERVREAVLARMTTSSRLSTGITFAVDARGLVRARQFLHRMGLLLKGLWESGSETLLLAQLSMVPASRAFTTVKPTPVEEQPPPPELDPSSPMGLAFGNAAQVSWQDVVRRRLSELGMTQRDLAAAIGRHYTWVSRVLDYTIDVHRSEGGVVERIMNALQLHEDTRSEFRGLVDLTHPEVGRRAEAADYIAARVNVGFVLTEDVDRGPLRQPHPYDDVLKELIIHGALPDSLEAAARLVVPPITPDQAADAVARVAVRPNWLEVQYAAPIDSPERRAGFDKHAAWCEVVAAQQGVPDACNTTLVVPAPSDGVAIAREMIDREFTVLLQEIAVPAGTRATVRHLRCSVRKGAG